MMDHEKDAFRKCHHVRMVEKCCGTCRHFCEDYEETWCSNPVQAEFDSEEQQSQQKGNPPRLYDSCFDSTMVTACHVCDLWTARPTARELLEELRSYASKLNKGKVPPLTAEQIFDIARELEFALDREQAAKPEKEGGKA